MMAILIRFMVSAAGLGIGGVIFPGTIDPSAILAGSIMLSVLYILLRPLMQLITLPGNLLLGGLLTPLADGLFLLWTSAWINGISLGYWQSVATALLMSALYFPYSLHIRRKLTAPVAS